MGYYSLACKPGRGLKNHLTSNSSKRQSQNSNPGLSDSKTFVPKIIDSFVFTDHVSGGESGSSADGEVQLVDFLAFHSMKFVEGVTVMSIIYETLFMAWKWWERAPSHSGDFYLLKTYTLNVLWKSPCTWLSCAMILHEFKMIPFLLGSYWFFYLSTSKRHDHLPGLFLHRLCPAQVKLCPSFPKNGPPKSSPFLFHYT